MAIQTLLGRNGVRPMEASNAVGRGEGREEFGELVFSCGIAGTGIAIRAPHPRQNPSMSREVEPH
jgi:hypothetical protein